MLFVTPATGSLACVGFDFTCIVYCSSLLKGEKGKWVSSAIFHLFLLQNIMIVTFLVKSVHSWDLDWHGQYSLTSDAKPLPNVGNT